MSLLLNHLRRVRSLVATTATATATTRRTDIVTCISTSTVISNAVNDVARQGRQYFHQRAYSISSLPSSSLYASSSRTEMQKQTQQQKQEPSRRIILRPSAISTFSSNTINNGRRSFSFYNNDNPNNNKFNNTTGGQPNRGSPAYTVYGEEIAFTVKVIPPEFRALPSGTMILDAGKRGRLLFEWTPMSSGHDDNSNSNYGYKKFRWDASTRFALTAEEAASLLARLDRGDPSVELTRKFQDPTGKTLDKVFIAKNIELETTAAAAAGDGDGDKKRGGAKNDGISLLVDYVDPEVYRFGQIPHPTSGGGAGGGGYESEGVRGPFEIRLMVGEYQVLRSIIEYSIPKLVGWSTMLDRTFDRTFEQVITQSVQGNSGGNYNNRGGGRGEYGGSGSPHNYQGSGGGDGGSS